MMRRTVLRSILLMSALAAGITPALAATAREQTSDFFRAVQMDDPGTVQSLLGKEGAWRSYSPWRRRFYV